jgi:hypothetical protein
VPSFPDTRLRQAGISAARVAQLLAQYDAMTPPQQAQFRGIVASRPDEVLRRTYDPNGVPAAATTTADVVADPALLTAVQTAILAAHDTDTERETFIPSRLSDTAVRALAPHGTDTEREAFIPARLSGTALGATYKPIGLTGLGARPLLPPSRVISRFAAGHAWTGGADDLTVKLYGDRSYKGVTDGVGGQKVLAAPSTPVVDWTGTYVRIAIRVDDPLKLGSTQLAVDAPAGSTYTFSVVGSTGAEGLLSAGEWTFFTFPLTAGTVTGTPTWTTVSRPRLVTRDRGAGAVTINIGAVELLPNLTATYPAGVLVLEADDGFTAHKTILRPMLDALGVPCTLNPIIERITNGTAGMTVTDLRDMQDRSGWQISAHAYTQAVHNGPLVTPADAATDFAAIKKWMRDNGFHAGSDDFALCPGVGTRLPAGTMRDTVAAYWRSARMFTGFGETVVPADPLSFRSIGFSGNSVAQLQANVDQAAGPGGVFHLSLHDVLAGATNGTSSGLAAIAVNNLQTVLSYALGKGMVPRTRGEWLALR